MNKTLDFVKKRILKDIKVLKMETKKLEKTCSLIDPKNVSFLVYIEPTEMMSYHFDATRSVYKDKTLEGVLRKVKLGEEKRDEKIKRKDVEVLAVIGDDNKRVKLPPRFWRNIVINTLGLKI